MHAETRAWKIDGEQFHGAMRLMDNLTLLKVCQHILFTSGYEVTRNGHPVQRSDLAGQKERKKISLKLSQSLAHCRLSIVLSDYKAHLGIKE